jgi:hypothetical protein
MTNLFTNYALIKSVMKEARRIKPVTERAAIKIQKEIDYAAEHGRGEVVVHTGDFLLSTEARNVITQELQKAGYKHRWRQCGQEEERVYIWWEDKNED